MAPKMPYSRTLFLFCPPHARLPSATKFSAHPSFFVLSTKVHSGTSFSSTQVHGSRPIIRHPLRYMASSTRGLQPAFWLQVSNGFSNLIFQLLSGGDPVRAKSCPCSCHLCEHRPRFRHATRFCHATAVKLSSLTSLKTPTTSCFALAIGPRLRGLESRITLKRLHTISPSSSMPQCTVGKSTTLPRC